MIFSRTLEHRQSDVVLRKTQNAFNLVAVLSANLFWHDVVQHCGFEIMLTIATTFKLAEIHLVFLKWINLYSPLYCPPICFPTSQLRLFPQFISPNLRSIDLLHNAALHCCMGGEIIVGYAISILGGKSCFVDSRTHFLSISHAQASKLVWVIQPLLAGRWITKEVGVLEITEKPFLCRKVTPFLKSTW